MKRTALVLAVATSLVPGPAFGQSAAPEAPRPVEVPPPDDRGEALTFDASVARALARNPTALQAREEVARSRAVMEQVRAAALPTLAGVGTYLRLDSDRVSNGAVLAPKGQLNLDLTLAVPLLVPKAWMQWGQAGDQIDVARANEADVRRSVAVATARAYLTIITQKRLRETARIARDSARAHYEFTHAQRQGGIGNRLDESRAAQELTADEVNLQNQLVALARAREGLGVLVGAEAPVDTADQGMPSAMPPFDDALKDVALHRTDVRARTRVEKAAERSVHDAWADYSPFLVLMAQPFYQTPPTPTVPRTGWQAELVLTLPLYDGGLRYGQEHERQAVADEATLNVEATLRQARSDVRFAFEEMRRADVALEQASESAAFAKQALELANEAYRAGATSNLEVIDAERQARDAATLADVAEDEARQARLDVLVASGRFP